MPLWSLILFSFIAYLAWELYWFSQIGLRAVKWHTHLFLLVYIWAACVLILRLILVNSTSKNFINGVLSISAITAVLFILESFLLITGFNKTYLELVGNGYFSPYAPEHETYYHTWSKGEQEHWLDKPEYRYWRPNNSLGYPDKEWTIDKDKKSLNILALGDSFTEGDGAPYDSSYVAVLRTLLTDRDSINIMNAGVCGSDPFFDFLALKDHLIDYYPDIVLQTLSTQDLLTDIIIRGGLSRFQEPILTYNAPPWWEPIYALSYVSRYFFHSLGYTELLRKEYPTESEIELLNKQIISLLGIYQDFCKEKEVKLCVIMRPDREEVISNKYFFDFDLILSSIDSSSIKIIDLLPLYQKYIQDKRTEATDYFWVKDGHHNSKGYEMMAKCIYPEIVAIVDEN